MRVVSTLLKFKKDEREKARFGDRHGDGRSGGIPKIPAFRLFAARLELADRIPVTELTGEFTSDSSRGCLLAEFHLVKPDRRFIPSHVGFMRGCKWTKRRC